MIKNIPMEINSRLDGYGYARENGLAYIPRPAGPTRQTGKLTTPREQAHKGSGACSRGAGSKPKWGVGLAEKKHGEGLRAMAVWDADDGVMGHQ